ncbi:LysR family substrate-binding domain-containing protein [Streptomyces sp. NPDC007901]|uniref:LysR family substrate-binding domain-containing protein n=1 Tax=Streptomyces sp. NPDC007901 TaxID=3364785 RepID=UPI0036EEC464
MDTPSGQELVAGHELDIAVVRPDAPVRGLRARPWRHDRFVVALPAGHPLVDGSGRPVDLARFAEEPWVWLSRDASPDCHDQLTATCRRAGFTPDVRHPAGSIMTQLAMVGCGFGVTLVPHVTVRGTAFRPLTDRADIVELSLVCRSGAQEPLVAEFLRTASG